MPLRARRAHMPSHTLISRFTHFPHFSQVAAEAASFAAALMMDAWTGRTEANEAQRAVQLRGAIERLGPAYIKVWLVTSDGWAAPFCWLRERLRAFTPVCVCVCVCARERERQERRNPEGVVRGEFQVLIILPAAAPPPAPPAPPTGGPGPLHARRPPQPGLLVRDPGPAGQSAALPLQRGKAAGEAPVLL
jgi:hypothetical protein